MKQLDAVEMRQDKDPDVFFSRVQQQVEELEGLAEPVSRNRLVEIVLTSLPEEYSRNQDGAYDDPD